MPLRELQCTVCGYKLTELVKAQEYDAWKASVDAGDFFHRREWDNPTPGDGRGPVLHEPCGTMILVPSLTALTVNSEWPYTIAPWMLPPKDGKPQIGVTVNSRAEYRALLRKHNMVEPITESEKATMYDDGNGHPKDRIDQQAREDGRMYRALKSDPHAARRIIRESIAKRDAVAPGGLNAV